MNPCGFFKIRSVDHKEKKKQILDIAYDYERPIPDPVHPTSVVSNSDYEDHTIETMWAKIMFCPKTVESLKKKIEKYYGDYHPDIVGSWVSQYYANSNSEHLRHNHAYGNIPVNMCCIYYVDLPKRRLSTKFWHEDKLYSPKVREGDILFFDSITEHFSPPNNTNKDKTIVSCNFLVH